jgi:hypothetical protein
MRPYKYLATRFSPFVHLEAQGKLQGFRWRFSPSGSLGDPDVCGGRWKPERVKSVEWKNSQAFQVAYSARKSILLDALLDVSGRSKAILSYRSAECLVQGGRFDSVQHGDHSQLFKMAAWIGSGIATPGGGRMRASLTAQRTVCKILDRKK